MNNKVLPFWVLKKRVIDLYIMSNWNRTNLVGIKPSGTIYIIVLQNSPIRMLYLLDMTFWLDFFFEYKYKSRTKKIYYCKARIVVLLKIYVITDKN